MDQKKGSLEKLEITPLEMNINVDEDFVRFVKDRLLKWRKPVALGDAFTFKASRRIKVLFLITDAHPSEGVIDYHTELTIQSSPPERAIEREMMRMKLKAGDKIFQLLEEDQIVGVEGKKGIIVKKEEVEENGERYLILWLARLKEPEKPEIKFEV